MGALASKGLAAAVLVLLVVLAAGCGGGKPWTVQGAFDPGGQSVGRCASALSPDQTAQRVICRTLNGPFTCWTANGNGALANADIENDRDCKAALSVIRKSAFVP